MCHSEAETVSAICLQNRVPRVQVLLPLPKRKVRQTQCLCGVGALFLSENHLAALRLNCPIFPLFILFLPSVVAVKAENEGERVPTHKNAYYG